MSVQDQHIDPPQDKAAEYAQDKVDNLSDDEVVDEAIEICILIQPRVIRVLREALFDWYCDEYQETPEQYPENRKDK